MIPDEVLQEAEDELDAEAEIWLEQAIEEFGDDADSESEGEDEDDV